MNLQVSTGLSSASSTWVATGVLAYGYDLPVRIRSAPLSVLSRVCPVFSVTCGVRSLRWLLHISKYPSQAYCRALIHGGDHVLMRPIGKRWVDPATTAQHVSWLQADKHGHGLSCRTWQDWAPQWLLNSLCTGLASGCGRTDMARNRERAFIVLRPRVRRVALATSV